MLFFTVFRAHCEAYDNARESVYLYTSAYYAVIFSAPANA
jgi:hypothetical protein